MADIPVQRSEAAPGSVGDPVLNAQAVLDDPSKKDSPEWLAAKQLIADQGKDRADNAPFEDLEKEMQAVRGMSEI